MPQLPVDGGLKDRTFWGRPIEMIRNLINTLWDRWANLHPLLRFVAMIVAAALIGLVAVKPAYRVFKSWRMAQNLASARKAVEEVRMDEARDLSLTVLRAGDSGIEAFRILEKSTASLRDPRHGDIARALMSHPKGSDADRLTGFRGVVPNAPLGLLGQAWTTLPPESQKDPRFAAAFAERLIKDRRLNEAASVLLAVPEAVRDGAVERCLIRVLIGSGKREGFDEAQRLIAAGFPADGAERAAWFDLLEQIPAVSLQAKLLEPIRSRLERAADSDPARQALILARMDYAARFDQRADVLEQSIARWKDTAPVALARFLSDLGLHQRLLETLPVERLKEHPELFPMLLGAMERTGAWDQIAPVLDDYGHLMTKPEELAHRAIVALKTGDGPGHVQAWNAALAEGKSESLPGMLLTLHRIAAGAGMEEEAEQAMVEAIRMGRGPLPLYSELKPLLQSLAQQGRENTLLEICAIYLSFEPGNPVLLTQYAYLACLNNLADPATILKAVEPLAKGFPDELPIHCVLATIHLCNHQPAMAAEVLDRFKLDPAKLPPGYRAAFLTTQVLNGRIRKDDKMIAEFPWKSLQASERRKFTELIQLAEPETGMSPDKS